MSSTRCAKRCFSAPPGIRCRTSESGYFAPCRNDGDVFSVMRPARARRGSDATVLPGPRQDGLPPGRAAPCLHALRRHDRQRLPARSPLSLSDAGRHAQPGWRAPGAAQPALPCASDIVISCFFRAGDDPRATYATAPDSENTMMRTAPVKDTAIADSMESPSREK